MPSNIIVRDPFRDFDALVRRTFGQNTFAGFEPAFSPAVETRRDGDDAVIRLELPGVDVDRDIDIELRDRQLVISGSRRDEHEEDTDAGHLREFRYGSFRRAFRVGASVSAEDVSASYDAGVLTIRVAGAYATPSGQRIAVTRGERREVVQGAVGDEPAAERDAEDGQDGQGSTGS